MSSLVACPHPSACGVQSGHRPDRAALEACRRVGLALRHGHGQAQPVLAAATGEMLDSGTTRYLGIYASVEATGGTATQDSYRVALESATSEVSWEENFTQPIGEMTPTAQTLVEHYVRQRDPRVGDLLGEDFETVCEQLGMNSSVSSDPTSLDNDFIQPLAIRNLMDHYKLQEWSIETKINSDRIAGQCRYADKTLRFNLDMFKGLPNEDRRDTVLHEIAHAKAGENTGHGRVWKAMARAIGAKAEATRTTPVTREEYDAMRSSLPWKAECAAGHVEYRRSQPKKVMLCGRCLKPEDERLMGWTKKGEEVPMHKDYDRAEWVFKVRKNLIEVSADERLMASMMAYK